MCEIVKSPVINGCNGSCCEKFTLPVTINDLHKMKAEYNRQVIAEGEGFYYETQRIVCDNGYNRYPTGEDQIDKLLKMLIPLGVTNIDPQSEKDIASHREFIPMKHDAQMILDKTRGHNFISPEDPTKILTNIFTCKHFDTVQRICTNYENRPDICKQFGEECYYRGCGFVEALKAIDKITEK